MPTGYYGRNLLGKNWVANEVALENSTERWKFNPRVYWPLLCMISKPGFVYLNKLL